MHTLPATGQISVKYNWTNSTLVIGMHGFAESMVVSRLAKRFIFAGSGFETPTLLYIKCPNFPVD